MLANPGKIRIPLRVREHAPDEDRDSMIENVPLHRDIMRAGG